MYPKNSLQIQQKSDMSNLGDPPGIFGGHCKEYPKTHSDRRYGCHWKQVVGTPFGNFLRIPSGSRLQVLPEKPL